MCKCVLICSVVSDSLQPHGLQHTRTPRPSPTPRASSNSYPSRRCCHLTISSSVVPVSSHLQSFTSIKVLSDESALRIRWPKYGRFPLELTGLIQDGSLARCTVVTTVTVEAVAGRWGPGSTKPKIAPGPRSEGLHPERWPALAHGAL